MTWSTGAILFVGSLGFFVVAFVPKKDFEQLPQIVHRVAYFTLAMIMLVDLIMGVNT